MNEKNQIKLFRDPLDPRELSFGLSQPHTEPSHASGTGQARIPKGCTCGWETYGNHNHNILCPVHGQDARPVSAPDKQPRMDEKTLARKSDPATSKAAAKTVKDFAKDYHNKIIRALVFDGTFYDIARRANLEPSQVWRRLNELERKGLIEPTGEERKGPTGRLCRVWRLKVL